MQPLFHNTNFNQTHSIQYLKCIEPNLVSCSTTREQEKLLRKIPSPILGKRAIAPTHPTVPPTVCLRH